MGLVEHLGFSYGRQSAMQVAVARFVSGRFGSWLGKWLVPMLDRRVHALTGGKGSATSWLSGLPLVWLETVGRRTGLTRRHPLLAIPVDGELALIGSNFGQRHHPGWALNLETGPDAKLHFDGRIVPVRARQVPIHEVDRIWEAATERYPGYRRYRETVTTRVIKVFILETA